MFFFGENRLKTLDVRLSLSRDNRKCVVPAGRFGAWCAASFYRASVPGGTRGICGVPPHGTTQHSFVACALTPTLRLRLVRGYWDVAPTGLLKVSLKSQV